MFTLAELIESDDTRVAGSRVLVLTSDEWDLVQPHVRDLTAKLLLHYAAGELPVDTTDPIRLLRRMIHDTPEPFLVRWARKMTGALHKVVFHG